VLRRLICYLVVHYSEGDSIEQEAPHEISGCKPPHHWPMRGAIEFRDVVMCYRPGLPNVLHGISMSINGGEKIGVVGRTGAGKSSLALTLLRLVEYSGSIIVDGYVGRNFSSVSRILTALTGLTFQRLASRICGQNFQ
jgi:ABC-type multidrug transport system fused ATPase/permease subunit